MEAEAAPALRPFLKDEDERRRIYTVVALAALRDTPSAFASTHEAESTNTAERSGKLVCEAVDVSYAWDKRPIIRNFSTTILRGDRIGIIGPNGTGKTTLLRLLLGDLEPDSGSVRRGTRLEVAYFDQLREQLDPDKNLIDNICGGQEFIEINGKRKHAVTRSRAQDQTHH